ncbi:hypothetical protein Dimus_016243, partial [Dionaea muscipula]
FSCTMTRDHHPSAFIGCSSSETGRGQGWDGGRFVRGYLDRGWCLSLEMIWSQSVDYVVIE